VIGTLIETAVIETAATGAAMVNVNSTAAMEHAAERASAFVVVAALLSGVRSGDEDIRDLFLAPAPGPGVQIVVGDLLGLG
jgi:hypothetical protein